MTTDSLHHPTYINVPEAVGVFDDVDALQAAIYDLLAVGFTRYDISLLAREEILTALATIGGKIRANPTALAKQRGLDREALIRRGGS